MTRISDFYAGLAWDQAGRSLAFILAQSDAWLECQHDYIQWLFPLPEPSPFNPQAPLLEPAEVQLFRTDPQLQARLLTAWDRLLRCYGLQRQPQGLVTDLRHPGLIQPWSHWQDHHQRRLTRMLRCLALCGLTAPARQLQDLLLQQGAGRVNPTTLGYWQRALDLEKPLRPAAGSPLAP
ncbi:MAG: hypothetical protein LRY38_06755 [Aeromonadaceae bacterium]|nr:hypothetical protein [Aeromonadaceae bacterium]